MDQPQPQLPVSTPVPGKPKQTWHKPTLVFVPLQATANGSGDPEDANASSTPD